jgi:hypothetical protein
MQAMIAKFQGKTTHRRKFKQGSYGGIFAGYVETGQVQ